RRTGKESKSGTWNEGPGELLLRTFPRPSSRAAVGQGPDRGAEHGGVPSAPLRPEAAYVDRGPNRSGKVRRSTGEEGVIRPVLVRNERDNVSLLYLYSATLWLVLGAAIGAVLSFVALSPAG